METWQLCPKCKGNKKQQSNLTQVISDCNICNGTGIISILNGLPPKKQETNDRILK